MAHAAVSLPALPIDVEVQPDARQRIVQAAMRLFGQQGYARTSIQDIADAAGVKKPILYYYFASKEALYQDLVSDAASRMRELLAQAMAAEAPQSCEERLCRLAETLVALARDNQDPVRFFFAHIFAPDADRPLCAPEGEAIAATPEGWLRRLAEEGIRAGEIAGPVEDLERLVLGGIQYSILQHLRQPDLAPLDPGLGRRIVAAALYGLARPH